MVGALPHLVEEVDPLGVPTLDQRLQLGRRRPEDDRLHQSEAYALIWSAYALRAPRPRGGQSGDRADPEGSRQLVPRGTGVLKVARGGADVMTMSRRIRLRYPAVCAACDAELQAGVEASWNSQRRTATCVRCASAVQVPVIGSAGASARAEAERRRARQRERHDKIKQAHPVLGRIALAVLPEPDAGRSWETGALGEERLGRFLDAIATDTVLLHDRRIPGTKANIDHIVVAANGVWIVDAKRYKGKVEKRDVAAGSGPT